MCIYTYTYIYIERDIYVYVYIHILYTYNMCIYTYTYIYIERDIDTVGGVAAGFGPRHRAAPGDAARLGAGQITNCKDVYCSSKLY